MKRLYAIFFSLVFVLNSYGQDSIKTHDFDNWNVRLGPFFWLINIKGTLERPPAPIDPVNFPEPEPSKEIDLDFTEVSSLLKFAFLLNAEFQHNRFVAAINNTSFILDGEVITPFQYVFNGIEYQFSIVMSEGLAGYKLIHKPVFDWEGYAGVKLIFFDIRAGGNVFKYRIEGERNLLWLDPIIATKVRYRPWRRFEFVFYGDYGPVRNRDQLTSQFYVNMNYSINKWLYVAPGYRHWWFSASRKDAIFNGSFNGFYFRLGFQF